MPAAILLLALATLASADYERLKPAFERNAFGRPLQLASRDDGARLQGEVHALLDHLAATVREALDSPRAWCDVLTLPFNVKGCEAKGRDGLTLYVGRTWDTPIADAVRLEFRFQAASRPDGSLEVKLATPQGPIGTRDYRIVFDAVPVEGDRTLVRLAYGYSYGTMSRLAMQAYLATSGASKVGFSREPDGTLVHGMRGVLERNTMRYFLAVDAYLDAMGRGSDAAEARMAKWHRETERYPKQLHEMSREEYLAMKRRDLVEPSRRLSAR